MPKLMPKEKSRSFPTYFLSHGGGPWPWFEDESREVYGKLEHSLKSLVSELGRTPEAILVISAHWEESDFTIIGNPRPGMIYDYSGFPDYLYQIEYPAPGAPEVAKRVSELLTQAKIPSKVDLSRGFDHGVYSVLKPMFPDASVRVLQLSLKSDLNPESHLQLGRALAPLREEGVLIMGSGLSYHNLRRFGAAGKKPSAEFDAWLQTSLLETAPETRTQKLIQWERAPAARLSHPREDHLIPLLVAVGAAESEEARLIYYETDFFDSLTVSSYQFGS